ncbi:MAG: hypothetical protein CVU56_27920 [Deltaproteobacteria bacterium HGW-Deltaproteobacteria-14]|jgi:hypothetical protein|nr:MAG: hypothetical protein CVU56_27920 [Deltaproteobacteria bacterium HGW-Deltaproteobacteria-14]
MTERVNRRATRRVTVLLGACGVAAGVAGSARAAPASRTPTGSKVEIIFLDDHGRPLGSEPAPSVAPQAPEPRPEPTPPPTTPIATPPRAAAPRPPVHATTDAAWGTGRRRPILGDGSNAAELVAAAQRVVGLRGRADRSLVAHVLASAGVPLTLVAPAPDANLEALGALFAAGRQVGGAGPRDLAFGDVLFFSRAGDGTVRFGVVEAVDPTGAVHVIGENGDVVSRFVLTAEHHAIRAVARP